MVDVCLNVLDTFEEGGITFSRLIILLPTAPFTRAEDIRGASVFFDSGNALFLQSVSEYREDIFSALEFVDREAGKVRPVFPDFAGKKRHELPVAYEANGAITIVDVKSFRSQKTYFGTPLCAYRMPRSRRVDIDTAEDFEYAEYLMSKGDPSV